MSYLFRRASGDSPKNESPSTLPEGGTGSQVRSPRQPNLGQGTPRSVEIVDDLSELPRVSTETVVTQLQARARSRAIYVRCGPLLVAVNPYELVPSLYDEGSLEW